MCAAFLDDDNDDDDDDDDDDDVSRNYFFMCVFVMMWMDDGLVWARVGWLLLHASTCEFIVGPVSYTHLTLPTNREV